jgi:hypothetical protein
VRKPGSEGLSERRDAGEEEEEGAAAAAKGIGLTSLCSPFRNAGTTGRAGREMGKEGEQEEQEEDAAKEEQQVVVSEEEEDGDDDDEE